MSSMKWMVVAVDQGEPNRIQLAACGSLDEVRSTLLAWLYPKDDSRMTRPEMAEEDGVTAEIDELVGEMTDQELPGTSQMGSVGEQWVVRVDRLP